MNKMCYESINYRNDTRHFSKLIVSACAGGGPGYLLQCWLFIGRGQAAMWRMLASNPSHKSLQKDLRQKKSSSCIISVAFSRQSHISAGMVSENAIPAILESELEPRICKTNCCFISSSCCLLSSAFTIISPYSRWSSSTLVHAQPAHGSGAGLFSGAACTPHQSTTARVKSAGLLRWVERFVDRTV